MMKEEKLAEEELTEEEKPTEEKQIEEERHFSAVNSIEDYVLWTQNTCAELSNPLTDVVHMLFGMSTEVGELIDIFKKFIAYGKEVDTVNVIEEVGDIMYYVASFCRIYGISLSEALNRNIAKLETRYPEKFTEYHANNRDLEKEREQLEG